MLTHDPSQSRFRAYCKHTINDINVCTLARDLSHDLAFLALFIELMHGLSVSSDDLHNTLVVVSSMVQQAGHLPLQLALKPSQGRLRAVSCALLLIWLCVLDH